MPVARPEETPDVSIGIPTRNAGPLLRRLLDRVLAQETERRFEIMAFDSGSTDGTLEVLAQYPVRLLPIDQGTFDWGRLRDHLHAEARGKIVISLSQDAIPARTDWLDNLVRPLNQEGVGASCGSSLPDPERPIRQFQWEKNGYYYFTREIRKFVQRYGKGLSFANTAVPKAVWEKVRVDPQATGEDFGFQIKLKEAGFQIAFPQDAPVLHHHNYSLKGVFRRCRNEGLALRQMGCAYTEADVLMDLLSAPKYLQWLREVRRGTLRNAAEWCYPVLRPVAVYYGSRFARKMVWY